MKRRNMLTAAVLLVCLLFSSCQTQKHLEDYGEFYALLGETKAAVAEAVSLETAESDMQGKQETCFIETEGRKDGLIRREITFYQDVLIADRLIFDSLEQAYAFSQTLRENLEKTFGEKATYPGVTGTNSGYYDNLTGLEDIQEEFSYYEDWLPEFPESRRENFEKAVDGRPYERIQVRFQLTVWAENLAAVSVQVQIIPQQLKS